MEYLPLLWMLKYQKFSDFEDCHMQQNFTKVLGWKRPEIEDASSKDAKSLMTKSIASLLNNTPLDTLIDFHLESMKPSTWAFLNRDVIA